MLDAVPVTSGPTQRASRQPAGLAVLTFLLPLMVIAGVWTLATPIDGSPDEYRHLIYGYALSTGQVTSTSTTYSVPDRIGINRSACYSFSPEDSAACDRLNNQSGSELITTATSANNYPRFYYRIAGWPLTLTADDLGVYLARMVGSVVSCTLLALGFACARRLPRAWLALGLLLATTPMVFFLIGSFNPHGVELAACAAFTTALLVMLANPTRAGTLVRFTTVVAIVPMVVSRPNGFAWPFVLAGLVMLAVRHPLRAFAQLPPRFRWLLGLVTGAAVVYAVWWQWTRGGRDTGAGVIGPVADTFRTPVGELLQILTKAQTFPGDWIGTFGWLDTRVTSATLLLWFGALGGVVLIGLTLHPGRLLGVAGLALAGAVLFAVAVDGYYRSVLGITVVQGRYVLPFAMVAICLITLNMSGIEVVQDRLPGLLAMVWVIGSAVALVEGLRRYTVGVSLRSVAGYWGPPFPVAVLLLVGGLAMIRLAHVAARRSAT